MRSAIFHNLLLDRTSNTCSWINIFGSAAWVANLAPLEVLLPWLETIGLCALAFLAYRIVTWISSRATGLAKIIIAIVVIVIAADS